MAGIGLKDYKNDKKPANPEIRNEDKLLYADSYSILEIYPCSFNFWRFHLIIINREKVNHARKPGETDYPLNSLFPPERKNSAIYLRAESKGLFLNTVLPKDT